MCFELENVDFESLEGESKDDKIMSLLRDLNNRNRLGEVEAWIVAKRPDIDLSQTPEADASRPVASSGKGSVDVEDSTFVKSDVKARGKGIGLKRIFSWGSNIDISTNDGVDKHGE